VRQVIMDETQLQKRRQPTEWLGGFRPLQDYIEVNFYPHYIDFFNLIHPGWKFATFCAVTFSKILDTMIQYIM
jgi:hypothetical protein